MSLTRIRMRCSISSRRGQTLSMEQHTARTAPPELPPDVGPLDEDVRREREVAWAATPSQGLPVVVRDLRREFVAAHCGRGGRSSVAVKSMSFRVAEGECFGCGTACGAAAHCCRPQQP